MMEKDINEFDNMLQLRNYLNSFHQDDLENKHVQLVIKDESFTSEENIIAEAILAARHVQEFIWGEISLSNDNPLNETNKGIWVDQFQKRVVKINEINFDRPSARIELRKRLLQQAALSVAALKTLK